MIQNEKKSIDKDIESKSKAIEEAASMQTDNGAIQTEGDERGKEEEIRKAKQGNENQENRMQNQEKEQKAKMEQGQGTEGNPKELNEIAIEVGNEE